MAQHDYQIADQPGASFLADLNAALSAIVSNNAGPTEPSPTYAHQIWADTTSGKLKMRNASNTAWVELGTLGAARFGFGTTVNYNVGTSGNSVPLLNGNNTFSGSNTFPPPMTAGNPLIRGESVSLPNNVDLNSGNGTGFYRLGTGVVNGPPGVSIDNGQLIVSKGGGTITQIVTKYNTSEMWTRSGNPPSVGGNGSWSAWLKIASPLATQAEMKAGTETAIRSMSPKSIREAFNAIGSAPVYACRAWVSFNGTGTVSILASGNVSSITDNGTGDYTVNFTTAMPDTYYSVAGGFGWEGYVNNVGVWGIKTQQSYMTTTSVRIRTIQVTDQTTSFIDPDRVFVQIIR